MRTTRIHVTGASGSGVTTLGRALAGGLAIPHHDTDDYFWLPTEPPYTDARPIPDRVRLMREMFVPRASWVLSGSVGTWARDIEPGFDCVVYVSAPTEVRLARLRQREKIRYGLGATGPDDPRHKDVDEFLKWAACYDHPAFNGRSRARHEAWLGTLSCRIARSMALARQMNLSPRWYPIGCRDRRSGSKLAIEATRRPRHVWTWKLTNLSNAANGSCAPKAALNVASKNNYATRILRRVQLMRTARSLIPRRTLFDNPTFFGAKISPDGRWISGAVDTLHHSIERYVAAIGGAYDKG